jgi:hypothetical protein
MMVDGAKEDQLKGPIDVLAPYTSVLLGPACGTANRISTMPCKPVSCPCLPEMGPTSFCRPSERRKRLLAILEG